MDVDLGIFFVDVENAEYPAERLCNDGGNGHARYPPVEYHHEQKVQYDVDDARYDKEQQRRFAVAQTLKDAGVGIIPQAADQPAQHDDHVDPALVRGVGRDRQQRDDGATDKDAHDGERHDADDERGIDGVDGGLQAFGVARAVELAHHDHGSDAQPHKHAGQQEHYRERRTHGGQRRAAHKAAHYDAVHHIVKLLEHVAHQQRQREKQDQSGWAALRHIRHIAFYRFCFHFTASPNRKAFPDRRNNSASSKKTGWRGCASGKQRPWRGRHPQNNSPVRRWEGLF